MSQSGTHKSVLFSILLLCLNLICPALASEESSKTEALPPSGRSSKPKIGLALGGGGARGAAHVGVLKVLKEAGVPVDYVCGTSIGSVVGGLYAAGVPIENMQEQFADGKLMHSFMTVPLWVRIIVAPVMVLPRAFGSHPYDGLYRGNKFRNFLVNDLPAGERNIEDLKIPYSAVGVSLLDGKAKRISKGSLGYAMQASCAVPGLRKPVEIDGDLYCDGGIAANVPVKLCREMGADIVIAVCIDERVNKEELASFRKMGSVSKRLIKLQLADLDAPQLEAADQVIHPNVDGVSLISTKKSDAQRAIKAGEEAARAALPLLKKKLAASGIAIADTARTQ